MQDEEPTQWCLPFSLKKCFKRKERQEQSPKKSSRFFGVTLDSLYKVQENLVSEEGIICPTVVYHCICYLKNVINLEGLFRVSGTWSEIDFLKNSFEEGQIPEFSVCENPHSIASLLDLFLRQLQEPLLSTKLYQEFLSAVALPEADRIKSVYQVLKKLPENNLHLLKYLIQFLYEITLHSEHNKMDAKNLAIIFGPILLGNGEVDLSITETIQIMKTQSSLVELIITNYPELLEESIPKKNASISI